MLTKEHCFGCDKEILSTGRDAIVHYGRTSDYTSTTLLHGWVNTAKLRLSNTRHGVLCHCCVFRALLADSRDSMLMILATFVYAALIYMCYKFSILENHPDLRTIFAVPLIFPGVFVVLGCSCMIIKNFVRLLTTEGRDHAMRTILRRRGDKEEMWTRYEIEAKKFPET
jgi:hypothetical protein